MDNENESRNMETSNIDNVSPSTVKHSAFIVPFSNNNGATSLQDAFRSYLEKRQKEVSDRHKAKRSKNCRIPHSDHKRMQKLRALFLKQAMKYKGVPYAKRYWTPEDPEYTSPIFLDCCGLVRRALWDLKKQFGFKLGPWNQAYMYDTLPITLEDQSMKPGDLIFIEGEHYNTKQKVQKHNIVHVEIYLGDGERTLGARWQKGYVQEFDSYKFVSKSYEIKRYIFKSIDTWLAGICRSFCAEHRWNQRKIYSPSRYSIFNPENSDGRQKKRKCRRKKKRKSSRFQQDKNQTSRSKNLHEEKPEVPQNEEDELLERGLQQDDSEMDQDDDNVEEEDEDEEDNDNLDELSAGDTDDELIVNNEKDASSLYKIVEEYLTLDDDTDDKLNDIGDLP